jgi:tetratricopeptide (TPR) repeat protein
MHNYTAARASYNMIERNTLFYPSAQWNIADTYILENNVGEALKTLEALTDTPPLKRQALTQMADLMRADKQYDRAIDTYSKVIADLGDTPQKKDWGLYYARAICYESIKQWDKAEADLEAALKLSPDQAEALNYLGYSWADKGIKLDQAYNYIARAHQQTPDDPYITDSAGWVLYQMGYFKKAVTFLEQSVQQLPADPTINDHLGDAYWQVGREHEARFQWERALKNSDDQSAEMVSHIKDKLKDGLTKKQAHNGPLPEIKTSQNINTLLQRLSVPIGPNNTPMPPSPFKQ